MNWKAPCGQSFPRYLRNPHLNKCEVCKGLLKLTEVKEVEEVKNGQK